MKTFVTLVLGTCMTVALAGAGFAQSSNMSASEKTTWQKCQGMSSSAMQDDTQCSALMKKYPDAAKSGTTGSNAGSAASPSSTTATTPSKSK